MANPFSIIHNYDNGPLFKRDIDLVRNVEAYKQGTLNQSRSTIQSTYDQIANLDLVKEVDKEYASKRLQANLDVVNKYAGMDLSDPGLSASLVNNLNQSLDQNVRNALTSSNIYRMEQAAWQKLQQEKPDKFSQVNYNYQQQFAQPWLQSEKVGENYRGGAGVKEFVDVNANLTKVLPDIAKNMKWEYVVDGSSASVGGYKFRDAITKEEVSRDRVESAIESMLGPKEREQLQINAWGQYDGLDDEDVRSMYDQYMAPKIQSLQKQSETMRALAEQADPSKRDQYITAAEKIDQNIQSIQNNGYESVGKRGAYTAIYYDQFKNNYLNAYSYAPITIKQEVNALDQAVFNASMKLNEDTRANQRLNLDERKFEFSQQREASRLELDWYKAGKIGGDKATAGESSLPTGTDEFGNPIALPFRGSLTEIDKENGYGPKTATSNRDRFNELEKRSIESTKRLLNNHNLSENTLNSKGFLAAVSKYAGGETLQYKDDDGKLVKINLSDGDKKSLNNYKSNVLEDPAYVKRANDRLQTGVNSLLYTMERTAASGDWDPRSLTNFNIMLDKDPNDPDKYIVRKVDKAKVDHYYASLIYKKGAGKKLTDVENKNLQFYTQWMVIGDQKTSEPDKQLSYKFWKKNLWNVNDSDGLLPQNWYSASTIVSRRAEKVGEDQKSIDLVRKSGISQFVNINDIGNVVTAPSHIKNLVTRAISLQDRIDKGDRGAVQELNSVRQQIRDRSNIAEGGYNQRLTSSGTLSRIGTDLEDWSIEFPNAGKQLEDMWRLVNDEIEADTELTNLNPSKGTYTYSPIYNKESFERMNLVADMPGFKGSYKLIPLTDSKGVPTGRYDVFTIEVPTSGDNKGQRIQSEEPVMTLSEDDARKKFGIITDKSGNVMADATHGTYATEINLGSADPRQLSTRTKKYIAESNGSVLFPLEQQENNLLQLASQKGADQVVQYHINNLKRGKYNFKLISNGVTYDRVMFDDQGNEIGRVDDGLSKLTDDQVVEVQRTATYNNQEAFLDIMKDIIRTHVVETTDQYRQNYYGQ